MINQSQALILKLCSSFDFVSVIVLYFIYYNILKKKKNNVHHLSLMIAPLASACSYEWKSMFHLCTCDSDIGK